MDRRSGVLHVASGGMCVRDGQLSDRLKPLAESGFTTYIITKESEDMAQPLQIDTLAFSKSLKQAGADEQLAEAIVEGISKVDTSDLATKSDLKEVESALRGEISGLRGEMQVMEQRMTIKLGSMMMIGVGIIVALDKLL